MVMCLVATLCATNNLNMEKLVQMVKSKDAGLLPKITWKGGRACLYQINIDRPTKSARELRSTLFLVFANRVYTCFF